MKLSEQVIYTLKSGHMLEGSELRVGLFVEMFFDFKKYKMIENVTAGSVWFEKSIFCFFVRSILNPLKNDMEISGDVIHTMLSYVNE